MGGALGNVLAATAFTISIAAILCSTHIIFPNLGIAATLFATLLSARLLLPPYGTDAVAPDVSRSLLLFSLFGFALFVYERIDFQRMLLIIFAFALCSSSVSIALHLYQSPEYDRLVLFGRASHPIFGAGAIATGIFAGVGFVIGRSGGRNTFPTTSAVVIGVFLLIGALFMTGSRGPMVSFAFAVVATPIVMAGRSRLLTIIVGFMAWAIVTFLIVLEPYLHGAFCQDLPSACRDPARWEIWQLTIEYIARHPLWGSGYGFRFDVSPRHAHNGYLGMALHYGVPALLLFVALMATALWNSASIANRSERFFVVSSLIFANGFMGSDLSDPIRFFNTHYLFLWFPLFIALISEKCHPNVANHHASDSRQLPSAVWPPGP